MNKAWGISISITIMIWVIGIVGFILITNKVPDQFIAASDYISDPALDEEKEELDLDKKTVIHNSQKLVVMIQVGNGSIGSGFLYNNQGDIITNAHVVEGASTVLVKMADAREYEGKVIGISTNTDVAVVRVTELHGIDPLPIARDRMADVGDDVIALGSPLGLQNTVTTGIISGVDRDFELEPYYYEDAYQISAPITHGNSGGPLIDILTGEVLGINSAGADQGTIGFSIPIPTIISLVEGWSASPMTSLPNAMHYEYGDYYNEIIDTDLATYLVYYFYESINYGDYVTAYSLLGHHWQTNTSYETFRNGYIHTKYVTIDDMQVQEGGNRITVIAIISASELVNGEYHMSRYRVTYEIGYENDQMKIISGQGEKINS